MRDVFVIYFYSLLIPLWLFVHCIRGQSTPRRTGIAGISGALQVVLSLCHCLSHSNTKDQTEDVQVGQKKQKTIHVNHLSPMLFVTVVPQISGVTDGSEASEEGGPDYKKNKQKKTSLVLSFGCACVDVWWFSSYSPEASIPLDAVGQTLNLMLFFYWDFMG